MIGRLTKQVDFRVFKNGTGVANYTIAIPRNFKNSEGDYETDFINCLSFGKTAELLKEYVLKGDKIMCEGRMQNRSYENKEGKKVYLTEVVVDRIEFLESVKSSNTKTTSETKEKSTYKVEDVDNMEVANDPFADFGDSQIELPFDD